MLISGSNALPATALDHPMVAIEVEALLSIPLSRSGGAAVSSARREGGLGWKNKWLDRDQVIGSVVRQVQDLFRQPEGGRFTSGEWIPRLKLTAVHVNLQRSAPPCSSLQETMKDHFQMLLHLAARLVEPAMRPLAILDSIPEDPIEHFPKNDRAPSASERSDGLGPDSSQARTQHLPSIGCLNVVDVPLGNTYWSLQRRSGCHCETPALAERS